MNSLHKKHIFTIIIASLVVGFSAIFFTEKPIVKASSRTIGSIVWDNTNFINESFWDNSPTSGDIIKALFGSGNEVTAYTQNRSGRNNSQCPNIQVAYIGPGTGTIPQSLSGNYIYVLTGGDYITTGAIYMGQCSAIIGEAESYLYSTGWMGGIPFVDRRGIINIMNTGDTIIDHISVDGSGEYHTGMINRRGIFYLTSYNSTINDCSTTNNNQGIETNYAFNITINNSRIHHNAVGIQGLWGRNNTIDNSKFYDNSYGLSYYEFHNSAIKNSQFYNGDNNNNQYGVYFSICSNNVINNSQFYNNQEGISVSLSPNNAINNSQFYNNWTGIYIQQSASGIINNNHIYNNKNGIYLGLYADDTILHDNRILNNDNGIYVHFLSTGHKYYGTGYMFGNIVDIEGSGEFLTPGTGIYYTALGWTSGALDIGGATSRNHLANPLDSSGNYLLDRNTSFSGLRENFIGRENILPITYSMGYTISRQVQPVRRNADNTGLESHGIRDSNKLVGSTLLVISGSLSGEPTTEVNVFTATIQSNVATNWRLFGDIVASKTGTINAGTTITTGIILSGTNGYKNIFIQFWTGNYQTTHSALTTLFFTNYIFFTGVLADGTIIHSGGTIIHSGGQYDTTGVKIDFFDTNISGTTISIVGGGTSTYTNGTRIVGENTYIFTITDIIGNTGGISFTIDRTFPSFTGATIEGLPITSGGAYHTTGVRIFFSDANISGATITTLGGGTSAYTSGTRVVGGNTYTLVASDKVGHTTGITFTIIGWSNMSYINDSFWNTNPTSGEIIRALYGSGNEGSAYTQNRPGRNGSQCNLAGMKVQFIPPGTGTIPQSLSGNYIYVLTGGDYINTGTINMENCSVMIASAGSYLYSTGYLGTRGGIINILSTGNTIIDNIHINGLGSYHVGQQNNFGIYYNTSDSNTINNSKIENSLRGIGSYYGANITINNSQAYNNTSYGIGFLWGGKNTVNNSSVYNNNQDGVYILASPNNTINNSSVYNNNQDGIFLNGSSRNIINNNNIYNNQYGINFGSAAYNNILHDNSMYNNQYGAYLDVPSTGNKYYGTLYLFGNTTDIGGSGENLTAGSSSDLTGLTVTAGALDMLNTLGRGDIANPRNASSNYLFTRATGFDYLRGQVTGRASAPPIIYSLGGDTPIQTQPVKRNAGNTGLQYYGLSETNTSMGGRDWAALHYIGGNIEAISGGVDLSRVGNEEIISGRQTFYARSSGIDFDYYLTTSGTAYNYKIFGNFTTSSFTSMLANSSVNTTGLILTAGDGYKAVIFQLRTGGATATHYGYVIILDTILPNFTGTAYGYGTFTSGSYYNTTGVFITYSDTNLLGSTLNEVFYTGASLLITGQETYEVVVTDRAGNFTGITFTIDCIAPTFIGASNNGYYNTNITITGNDINFSGFQLSGLFYAGNTITITGDGLRILTGYDKAGNKTGIRFTIDRVAPTIGGATPNAYHNTSITMIGYDAAGFSGFSTNGIFQIGTWMILTGDGIRAVTGYDRAGNNSTGITFVIDRTSPRFTGATNTGLIITSGGTFTVDNISIQFSDANLSGATLNSAPYTSGQAITAEGIYTFLVTDRANNTTGITFTLARALSGQLILSGGAMIQNLGVRYTKGQASILARSNKAGGVTITGEFSTFSGSFSALINANQRLSYPLVMTGGEGQRFIHATFTGRSTILGIQSLPITKGVIIDLSGPVVTNALPNNGQVGITGDMVFGRSGSDDNSSYSGVGISGYYYFISNTGAFTNYVTSGFTTGITKNIPFYSFLNSGTYYRKVVGIDKLGNKGATGDTRSFDYVASVDVVPDAFTFASITDANANTAYMSNTGTITGVTVNVEIPVNIDNGVLYINGAIAGRTGTVKQGDMIRIELISSDKIDETVTSTLTIGSLTTKFNIKTSLKLLTLSSATKLNILTVFENIADIYADNKSKQVEFIVIFKSMLTDLIDGMEADNSLSNSEIRKLSILSYLLDITQEFIDDNDISDEGAHTAPNGKVYLIKYDDTKECYTSPNFLTPNKCFQSLEAMKSYINTNNKARIHTADTTRSAQNYQAPSGKIYTILRTTTEKYFSYRFISPKYFNSLAEIKTYISKNNPKRK